jgi:hypothetical protein
MYELLPIAVGISIGAGSAVSASRLVRAALVLAGLAAGTGAFVLSGEAELSPTFLLWDLAQVVIAAVLTSYAVPKVAARYRAHTWRH